MPRSAVDVPGSGTAPSTPSGMASAGSTASCSICCLTPGGQDERAGPMSGRAVARPDTGSRRATGPRSSSRRGELPRRHDVDDRPQHREDALHEFNARVTTMYANPQLVGDDRDLIPAGGFH